MKLLAWFRWTWWIAQARVWYKGMKRFAQGEWLAWCQVPVTSRGLASALQPCLLVLPQALLTCSECSSWLPASCTSLQLPCCSQAASVPCRLCCWNAEFEDKVIFLKEIFFLLMSSNLTFLCCDQAIFIWGRSLMLIYIFLEVWWLFWCSKDEEHCQGRCAHCSPKNSGKSSVLALWGLLSVQWCWWWINSGRGCGRPVVKIAVHRC